MQKLIKHFMLNGIKLNKQQVLQVSKLLFQSNILYSNMINRSGTLINRSGTLINILAVHSDAEFDT